MAMREVAGDPNLASRAVVGMRRRLDSVEELDGELTSHGLTQFQSHPGTGQGRWREWL